MQFEVENNTMQLMKRMKEELYLLPKERVFAEFRKALASNKPSSFFEVLRQTDLLEVHFKEIYDLIGQTQPIKYHPEGDSYKHTMIAVDTSAGLTDQLEIRYSTLVHDLGKGVTPKERLPHHYGHDEKGVELVRKLSNRIGVPTRWKKCGITAAKEHMRAGIFDKMKPAKQVKLIEALDKSLLGLAGMRIVVTCDRAGKLGTKEEINFETIGQEMLESVSGKSILSKYGKLEGKEFGRRLKEERIKFIKNCQKSIKKN